MIKLFLVLSVPSLAAVIADAAGGGLPAWTDWGIPGLVIAGFLTRQIVVGAELKEAKDDLKESRAETVRLTQLVLDTQAAVIPAISAATEAIRSTAANVRKEDG